MRQMGIWGYTTTLKDFATVPPTFNRLLILRLRLDVFLARIWTKLGKKMTMEERWLREHAERLLARVKKFHQCLDGPG